MQLTPLAFAVDRYQTHSLRTLYFFFDFFFAFLPMASGSSFSMGPPAKKARKLADTEDDDILITPLKPQPCIHTPSWSPRSTVCADVTCADSKTFAVRSVVYKKDDPKHDFKLMLQNPFHATTLFIINENFLGWRNPKYFGNGGGTAALRSKTYPEGYEKNGIFVAGIVTGWSVMSNGFTTLDQFERRAIDLSLSNVRNILREHPEIDNVVFASDETDKTKIGSGIFKVHDSVKKYISEQLHELTYYRVNEGQSIPSPRQIETMAVPIDRVAQLTDQLHKTNSHLKTLYQSFRHTVSVDDFTKRLINDTRVLMAFYSKPISQWEAGNASPF